MLSMVYHIFIYGIVFNFASAFGERVRVTNILGTSMRVRVIRGQTTCFDERSTALSHIRSDSVSIYDRSTVNLDTDLRKQP